MVRDIAHCSVAQGREEEEGGGGGKGRKEKESQHT
jgi:hypothetical protein